MLSKDKLAFDPANPDDLDNVGSYLRASDGTLLTHTDVGGKKSLDVNVANQIDIRTLTQTDEITAFQGTNPWTVDATDLDIRDLDHAQDDVAIAQGGNTMTVNTDGSINVNADIDVTNGAEKVEDTAHTTGDVGQYVLGVRQDTLAGSVDADGDYGSFKMNSLGELYTTSALRSEIADDAADTENPIKVGSQAVSGALSAVSASGDRANLTSDLYRRVYVNTSSNIGASYAAETVTTTAAQIASTALGGRRKLAVQNLGNKNIFIGFDASVTASNGLRVVGSGYLELDAGEDIDFFAIADTGSQDIRVIQMG